MKNTLINILWWIVYAAFVASILPLEGIHFYLALFAVLALVWVSVIKVTSDD